MAMARKARIFARLAMPPPAAAGAPAVTGSGADGMAVDEKGRLYVATAVGVQVFSEEGESLGIIALPKQPQNLAFSGPGRHSAVRGGPRLGVSHPDADTRAAANRQVSDQPGSGCSALRICAASKSTCSPVCAADRKPTSKALGAR